MLILVMALVACGPDTDDTEDTSEDAFKPIYGTWHVDSVETVEDGCGFDDGDDEDTGDEDTGDGEDDEFQITDNRDGTFQLQSQDDDPESNDMDVACTLTGKDFTCEVWTIDEQDVSSMDARVSITAAITGSFSDDVTLTATQVVDVSCTGEDCDDLAELSELTLPCQTTALVEASAAL